MKNNSETTTVFESLPVLKALEIMALPTIISQLIVLIYNFADTFYVGKTNDPHMVAALSLILPVFNITLSLASLTSVGSGTLISRLLGEKRESEARKICAFSIYASILAAALFSLLMAVFMEPVLYLLGADEHTMLYAKQYSYCVIVFGGIPTVLSNVLSNLLRSAGASREAGFGITFGGLINIALDPLFMFVLMPRGQEVLGAGVATCISNYIACLYFVFVIFRMGKDSVITFSLKTGMPSSGSIRSTFGVGVPAALTTLLFDLDYVVIDRLMVEYGNVALAAVGIVLKAERLPLNFGVGLCQGMMPLVAYNYSSGDHKRMKAVMLCALKVGLIMSAVSVALYELAASIYHESLHRGNRDGRARHRLPSDKGARNAANVHELLHSLSFPGVRQGRPSVFPRRFALARAEYTDVVYIGRHLGYVRHRVVADNSRRYDRGSFVLRL